MTAETRVPLSRERILAAAVQVADAQGIEALTMRRLAQELDVEAMSLYHHVAKKDDLLDGLVDVIAVEINQVVEVAAAGHPQDGWKVAMRHRILGARQVMLAHPWAPSVFESRTTTSSAVLAYYDALVGLMHAGGFSYDLAHHALHALGSRALGFAQELFDPAGSSTVPDPAELEAMAGAYPNLGEMLAEVAHDDPESTLGWCDDQTEFEFALDLLLDGLERSAAVHR